MTKAYEIGFAHGNSGRGTSGYAPGNRKPGGESWGAYNAGFDAGFLAHHRGSMQGRARLAAMNTPRTVRAQAVAAIK